VAIAALACEASPAAQVAVGSGTGFAVGNAGVVVTSNHVVSECSDVRVRTAQGLVTARVVAQSAAGDLAAIRLPQPAGDGLEIALADPELGAAVTVLGYPLTDILGADLRVTAGIVSSLSLRADSRLMQISAPIQPGNSGGPVLNEAGAVVGVVAAKLADRFQAQNVNFAVSTHVLRSFLDSNRIGFSNGGADPQRLSEVVKRWAPATLLVVCYQSTPDPVQAARTPQRPAPATWSDANLRDAIGGLGPAGAAPPLPQFDDIERRLGYLRWLGTASSRLRKRTPEWLERKELLQTVYYETRRAGIKPSVVLGLIGAVSSFHKFQTAENGARGYMAVHPAWVRRIGNGEVGTLFHMQTNLRYGCVLLRAFLDRRGGDLGLALTDYMAEGVGLGASDRRVKALVAAALAQRAEFEAAESNLLP
jgi:hypothetical protein